MRHDLSRLTDEELIASLKALARDERGRLVAILRHLEEMGRRRAPENRGFPSLFDYCIRELRWAEGETARRIHVARAAKKHPVLYRAIERGLLSLTTAALLAPHLTWDNHRRLIRSALGRKARDVEALVASLSPSPEPPPRVRFLGLPAATPPPVEETPAAGPSPMPDAPGIEPSLSRPRPPQRVLFSFTSDERLLASVERAKDLLRNKYGDPGLEQVFVEAVRALLSRIDPDLRLRGGEKGVRPSDPEGARSRAVPPWVKRAVWRRDGGRCAFRGPDGRCASKAGLQLDHVVPWALGGRSDDPANVRLLCRTHNALEARRAFGDAAVDAAVARGRADATAPAVTPLLQSPP